MVNSEKGQSIYAMQLQAISLVDRPTDRPGTMHTDSIFRIARDNDNALQAACFTSGIRSYTHNMQ
jgi:hypothetical protein